MPARRRDGTVVGMATRRNSTIPMGRRTRKAVLVAHIVTAGAWIGLDVVMGLLVYRALTTDAVATRAVSLQALEMVATWPLATLSLLCLATGVLLGLGTQYGLVRFWWVAVKLVLNVVLAGLVLMLLGPGVTEAGEYGRALGAGTALPGADLSQLVYPPVVSTTALVVATVIAVYKPWGRLRRRPEGGNARPVGAGGRAGDGTPASTVTT
jgi:hypothetical protein